MSDVYQDIEPPDVAFGQIYRGIALSSPSRLQAGIDIMIPDINPDMTFENVRSHAFDDTGRPQAGDEVLVIFDNNNQPWVISWAPGIPVGGSTNQVLAKNTGIDYDAIWKTVGTVPPGGTTGQVLAKINATDYNTQWSTPSGGSGLPTTVNGQWIKGVGGAPVWSPIVAADITSPVNGQFIKGVGGVAVWAALTPADVGQSGKVTMSAWSGGPPASPSNGDRWIALNVGAFGETWQFIYDTTNLSQPWKFIGGPPRTFFNNSTPSQSPVAADSAWHAIGTTFTCIRGGIWSVSCSVTVQNAVAHAINSLGILLNGTTPGSMAVSSNTDTTGIYTNISYPNGLFSCANGDTVGAAINTNGGGSMNLQNLIVSILPVEIAP